MSGVVWWWLWATRCHSYGRAKSEWAQRRKLWGGRLPGGAETTASPGRSRNQAGVQVTLQTLRSHSGALRILLLSRWWGADEWPMSFWTQSRNRRIMVMTTIVLVEPGHVISELLWEEELKMTLPTQVGNWGSERVGPAPKPHRQWSLSEDSNPPLWDPQSLLSIFSSTFYLDADLDKRM